MITARYDPSVFGIGTSRDIARQVILTPDGAPTDERWERETPYLVDLIEKNTQIDSSSLVMDYGCGIGRLSRPLIERYGCHVIGVDLSADMQALAVREVSSANFAVCAPKMLHKTAPSFNLILAVWVLQHVLNVGETIDWLTRLLASNGELFVLNSRHRLIPTDRGWLSDGEDVAERLDKNLLRKETISLDVGVLNEVVGPDSWCGVWQKVDFGVR